MSDIALSVCVVLGAAVLAGGLLLWTRRVARGREEELAAYCRGRGYRLEVQKEPTARRITIEADGWRLVSSRRAVQNESSSGSSGWQCETEWVCEADNPLRQTFALQVASGTMDVGRLPEWLREGALRALRIWLGTAAAGLSSIRTAFCENGRCGTVFEMQAHAADASLEKLRAPLAGRSVSLPLYLECSPSRIRLTMPETAAGLPQEIEAILSVGLALR